MKLYFILFLFFSSTLNLFSQENSFGIDEKGKLIFFELVNVKAPKDLLKARCANFFRQQKDLKYQKTQSDTVFNALGKFIIAKTFLMLAHPTGEISYRLQAEVKDEKYRFWFTDFNFIPYKKDRYGNFVPSTSFGVPLENTPSKQEQELWNEYKQLLVKHLNEVAAKIKMYMANAIEPNLMPVQKAITKTW